MILSFTDGAPAPENCIVRTKFNAHVLSSAAVPTEKFLTLPFAAAVASTLSSKSSTSIFPSCVFVAPEPKR